MPKLKNLKIKYKLGLGFGLLVFLTALIGVNAIYSLKKTAEISENIYEHPLTVGQKVREIEKDFFNIHLNVLRIIYSEDVELSRIYKNTIVSLEEQIHYKLDIIDEKYLGDKSLISNFRSMFDSEIENRNEIINYILNGESEKADSVNQEKNDFVDELHMQLEEIILYSDMDAEDFMAQARSMTNRTFLQIISILIIIIILGFIISFIITRNITKPLNIVIRTIKKIVSGNLKEKLSIKQKDELGLLSDSFDKMQRSLIEKSDYALKIANSDYSSNLKPDSQDDQLSISLNLITSSLLESTKKTELEIWEKEGVSKLHDKIKGIHDENILSQKIISFLVKYLKANIGAIYLYNRKKGELRLTASYAYTKRKEISSVYKIGEGLVGQAAKEKEIISLTEVPENYLRIKSSFGEPKPFNIIISPFIMDDELIGVLELGSLNEISDIDLELLKTTLNTIAIAINSANSRSELETLLNKTLKQAEEMRVQEEELRQINEELEVHTNSLKKSELNLQLQQEELRTTNEELEEKTDELEKHTKQIKEKNKQLEISRKEIEEKAKQVELASKYKSEFLANMSHELRTPLNSLLILSQNLASNKSGNLEDDQVESAKIINSSGKDLLELINEILDLSKIEAGKVILNYNHYPILDFKESMFNQFTHMASEKNLDFGVYLNGKLPSRLYTDPQKLEQILKNLISNAIKFTSQGKVSIDFFVPESKSRIFRKDLAKEKLIGISVSDTGIGIPTDKLDSIFEAFRQADGSTSRNFGGTGLGLSISKELARLLGGEIQVESNPGKGSKFTLFLPITLKKDEPEEEIIEEKISDEQIEKGLSKIELQTPELVQIPEEKYINDDRKNIDDKSIVLLVIEDDPVFAKIIIDQAHKKDLKCIATAYGENGIKFAEKYIPSAIILDIKLPGINGLDVLKNLKNNPKTRHIPVHMMSAYEGDIDSMQLGAIGYLPKPADPDSLDKTFSNIESFIKRKMKNLLIIEDDDNMRKSIKVLISGKDLITHEVNTGKKAVEILKSKTIDCIILDLGLPDMTGFQLLEILKNEKDFVVPPVIIYTGKELTKEENYELQKYTSSIIIKGVKSADRLLDETALFLHRVIRDLPDEQQTMITKLYLKDSEFDDKTILIVDDDMRNIFALTQVFEEKGMSVLRAEHGGIALEILEKLTSIDIVLMDIMMPVMDGFEAMRKIRKNSEFKELPIIALTAKAMKEDKEKCLACGASDYMAKPVDIGKLLTLMKFWLNK